MSRTALVINSGSSSIKYQLVDVDNETSLATGLVERIGQATGHIKHTTQAGTTQRDTPVPNHVDGFAQVLEMFSEAGPDLASAGLVVVGHRVVQGGSVFTKPTLVNDEVIAGIDKLAPLAPLHNPANLDGIRAAQQTFPELPHVVVFDTAFHQTMPGSAYTYAIPTEIAQRYSVRRYGAHGTSHKFVSEAIASELGRPLDQINSIVLHLGNGASVSAVRAGKSVETSMGLTPLEGLVMGTRSGDLDPAVVFHLARQADMTIDELDVMLNKQSGLLGLTGLNDMRDVRDAANEGDAAARLALEVYAHRVKGYIGNYYAQLGRLDAIAFTAGVGENDVDIRGEILTGLERLGIVMDTERNAHAPRGATSVISADNSEVTVFVIPTNEELEIARQAITLI